MSVPLFGAFKKVSTPSGFSWNTSPLEGKIYRRGSLFRVNFDVSIYMQIGKAYYVSPSGNDSTGDGLGWATAFKTLGKAIGMSDVVMIYLDDGIYVYNTNVTKTSLSIIARNTGKAIVTNGPAITWSLSSGKTYTYQGTIVNCGRCFDRGVTDSYGDYYELTLKASIDEVEANAGSYYVNGTTLYVHPSNNRSLVGSTDILSISTTGYPLPYRGDGALYLEGLKIEGGVDAMQVYNAGSNTNMRIYGKNLKMGHSYSGNALAVTGATSIMQNCVCSRAKRDGFNYHYIGSYIAKFIEINCIGRHNGLADTVNNNNNGSTSHEGAQGIRINGIYYSNKGPNVVDINDNTQTWNLGCVAYSSAGGTSASNTDYMVSTGGTKMWLDSCRNTGSSSTYALENDSGTADFYIHNGGGITGTNNLTRQLISY